MPVYGHKTEERIRAAIKEVTWNTACRYSAASNTDNFGIQSKISDIQLSVR